MLSAHEKLLQHICWWVQPSFAYPKAALRVLKTWNWVTQVEEIVFTNSTLTSSGRRLWREQDEQPTEPGDVREQSYIPNLNPHHFFAKGLTLNEIVDHLSRPRYYTMETVLGEQGLTYICRAAGQQSTFERSAVEPSSCTDGCD
jgi:hypothetical protein